jgi:hypothetical protein
LAAAVAAAMETQAEIPVAQAAEQELLPVIHQILEEVEL